MPQASSMFRLAEMRISQSLSLRKKFLYDLSVLEEDETEQPDAVMEMERFVRSVKMEMENLTSLNPYKFRSLATGGEVVVLGAARGPAGRLVQNMFKVRKYILYHFQQFCEIPTPRTHQHYNH